MTSLIRTRVGDFSISDAISLDDIKNNNIKMMDTKLALTNYKQVTTDTKLENKIKNGSIIPNIYNEEEVLFLDQNGNLLALYKKYDKNPDFLKPWKMLV
jgi:tRNA U55 pseudouridine synthase TruB